MGEVFKLAKEHKGMSLPDLERLLESEFHELRAGALAIMNEEAKQKRTTRSAAPSCSTSTSAAATASTTGTSSTSRAATWSGSSSSTNRRDVLYRLAASENLWERRTAIVSTWYFIRAGQTEDAVALSELLLGDQEDLIHKATGWMLRYIGDVDHPVLIGFLERHATQMPRTMLRYAIEKLSPDERKGWLAKRRE